jgi:hypothetical protein
MQRLEGGFMEELRAEVADEAAAAPTDVDGFIAWFEGLKGTGPGENDSLFPWLAETATREEFAWFLEQEAAGEAGFDDLVAMTQVKLPPPRRWNWRATTGTKWAVATSRACTAPCSTG